MRMLFRKLFVNTCKIIYKKEYVYLRTRVIEEYNKVDIEDSFKIELSKFLISGEDHRFRFHFGFDVIAIIRALRNRLVFKKIEGASTIEQQLVRVLTNNYEGNIQRKIKEIFLSTALSDFVPRKEIPAIYINVAFYGTGMIGLNQAIESINSKIEVVDTIHLCAELIARIKYPEPIHNSLQRQIQINNRREHLINLHKKHMSYKIIKIYG